MMELAFVIWITFIVCTYASNEAGLLVNVTDYDCGCPGQIVSYNCTAVGGVYTVWGGTALTDCSVGNDISLRHNDFENAAGECNNGAIVGYSIGILNDSYTSRLDVRLSNDLQGQTITCSVEDDYSLNMVGNATLTVSTQSAPPPPPDMVFATIARNSAQEIIFSWDTIEYNCPSLQYNFTSTSCGNCDSIAPTKVNCNSFTPSTDGITCSFSVRTNICGNIFGEERTATINLKVPVAPIIQSIPRYLDGQINILMQLITTFNTVEPFSISDEIDGSAINYTVTYSDSIFGSICGSYNISSSSCARGKCTHTFDVLSSSVCPQTTAITVNVFAINLLGRGPPSTGLVRDGVNNLVNVEFSSTDRSITCTFINQQSDMVKQCIANITYGSNCDQHLGTYTGEGTGDKVKISPVGRVVGVDEYCFLVNATSNHITVFIQGNLQNLDSQENLAAAITVPLVLLLLVQILLIIVLAAAVKYCRSTGKSNVRISFSVEDKPGSLASALKVFKDCNINILGLNTHLHHADFDRNAGEGYKFNYIHCKCTKSEKEFLKKELMAELEDSKDDEHHGTGLVEHKAVPVTAIIKVKDRPGALWNALCSIGNHGINIIGVNTLSDRESIPGYKYNYVKCCCSQGSLHRVCTALKMVTGKDVNTKFLDEEVHNEERTIQYIVRDQVGALGNTLQIISNLGINISGVNVDHLPSHIKDNRTTAHGLKMNFIECSIDRSVKDRLFYKLKGEYGAINVETHEVSPDKLEEDPNYCIVKVIIHNETGSLNRILKAFRDLRINIYGVNILEPAFQREREIPYEHYHLEITATKDQEAQLLKRLLAQGLAVDIKPFSLANYQETDNANERVQSNLENHCASDTEDTDHDSTVDASPSTNVIQFLVRDEVGTLANAIQIFSELGINITKVNPAHLSQEHQDEFIECSCAESQRESLINKLKSYGAMKAELLLDKQVQQQRLVDDTNYCVVKFSLSPKVGSFVDVLKAFSDTGVKIFKVNPPHIKVYNQYVECCCMEKERKVLLEKLKKIHGVTHVALESQDKVSVKPTQDPNYCIIKYSIGDRAGTLVRALKVFFDLKIKIIGVNTLNLAFDRTILLKYKHIHVVLVATDEQEEQLKHELLVTGLAIDVKPYEYIQHSDNQSRNGIALTSV